LEPGATLGQRDSFVERIGRDHGVAAEPLSVAAVPDLPRCQDRLPGVGELAAQALEPCRPGRQGIGAPGHVVRRGAVREQKDPPFAGLRTPEPTRTSELVWLKPYPDVLMEGLADAAPGPEARYETREAISLAFVTALQLLPPRQRAVLILRDVLGFRASEAARILDTTEESVTSALKRARATLDHRPAGRTAPPRPGSPGEQRLVERLVQAYQDHDLDGLIALLSDDVWLRMPPVPLEYCGRDLARQFFAVAFRPGRTFRLIATRANRQPAFGVYVADLHSPVLHASGLLVLTLAGDQICGMTRFDNSALPHFGLPRTLSC